MNKKLLSLLALFCLWLSGNAREYSVADVPNVHLQSASEFVSDPEGLMSPEARAAANRQLRSLMDSTSAEVAVVILPSIGDRDAFDFVRELGDTWKIGKKDKSNGLILFFAMDQHEVRIHTGYGLEGIIPDAVAGVIIRDDIIPAMRRDDLDGAVTAATTKISRLISDPEARDEVMSAQRNDAAQSSVTKEDLIAFAGWVAFAFFILAFVLFIIDLSASRKFNNYEKSLRWQRDLPLYWLCAALSLGSGLIFALLALWMKRHYRNKPVVCDTCGTKMHRLGEEEDNALLSPSQDLEEKLNTVDYDVWECPKCGTIERFPFKIKQDKYTECERCHTIAKYEVCDKIVVRPTVQHEGVREKEYHCAYCDNRTKTRTRIPKKTDDAAILAAAGMAAMSGRRGGGGGFGGGGSWGGGGFGGGGAGGRW